MNEQQMSDDIRALLAKHDKVMLGMVQALEPVPHHERAILAAFLAGTLLGANWKLPDDDMTLFAMTTAWRFASGVRQDLDEAATVHKN